MESKHTPTPWKAHTFEPEQSKEHYITAGINDQIPVAHTGRWDTASAADAASIVKACNEYEELIHELRMADGLLRDLLNFKWADDDDAHLRECVNERLVAIEPLISG